jgi:predicted transposase YbfD/YdcC
MIVVIREGNTKTGNSYSGPLPNPETEMTTPAQSLRDCLAEIRDFRLERKKRHLLLDILCIGICSVIANGDDWTDMEEFGRTHHAWLKTWLALPNGIPSHDTFRRVFRMLPPEQLHVCFVRWVQAAFAERSLPHIAIDGKTLRASGREKKKSDEGKEAVHMVSAFASQHGLVLGQVKNGDKSNEIKAIPELLDRLDISGATVTIDAMGCQKTIAQKVVEGGGQYILALKDNQKNLFEAVQKYFRAARASAFEGVVHEHIRTQKKEHGRWECRDYHVLGGASFLDGKEEWKGLSHVGWVHRECHANGVATHEDRFYLLSGSPTAQGFSEAARGHWEIENRLHWVLDVAFREDDCRITGSGAENLGVLRHMVLNLLREEKTCKRGIQGKRKRTAWDVNYLETVLKLDFSEAF